jgi:hypothetical protein
MQVVASRWLPQFDSPARECHKIAMKVVKPTGEKKTPGAGKGFL